MLKYWIRDKNSTIGINIFDNVFEVDVIEAEQVKFERDNPTAELVGDGMELDEGHKPMLLDGDTIYGPAFPFGAE